MEKGVEFKGEVKKQLYLRGWCLRDLTDAINKKFETDYKANTLRRYMMRRDDRSDSEPLTGRIASVLDMEVPE